MKKAVLLAIVTLAMVGISNAQTLCSGSPPPPGGCGYYDSDGYFWFTKCIYVNCSIDPNNCGGTGNTCKAGQGCSDGACTDPGPVSKQRPFRLKTLPLKVS